MWIIKKTKDLKEIIERKKSEGLTIGFVPTMGALHEGHISLVGASRKMTDFTACSIFVNPTQFNNSADLEKYPRTIERDISALEAAGTDLIFLPDVQEIYPDQNIVPKKYALGQLEEIFEGKHRPGHFQGVCQVVDILFKAVEPDMVFFGQKDYQQCMVIHALLAQTPEFENIKMHILPTIREPNGLAMSSRNMRLTPTQLNIAPTIFDVLQFFKNNISAGSLTTLLSDGERTLLQAGFKPDYVAIADAITLEPVTNWDGKQKLVALIAAYLGEIRLIDNLILN